MRACGSGSVATCPHFTPAVWVLSAISAYPLVPAATLVNVPDAVPTNTSPFAEKEALEISVPDVGKVTDVAPVAVRVVEKAPLVARVEPSARVSVADVAGAVIATLLTEVAVATPSAGVVNVGLVSVLLVRVCVPVSVATVESIAIVTAEDPS